VKTFNYFCVLAALTVSLAACGGKNNDSAPATSSTKSVATTSGAPECDAYVDRVNKCMEKLGANNAMATTYKQQMEAAKAQWATMQDKTALANVCKQANDAFNQSAQMLKCE
jgi:hypothetical protein